MGYYRKRPITVEAVRFLKVTVAENSMYDIHFDVDGMLPEWLRKALLDEEVFVIPEDPDFLFIKTLEGLMEASPGDWIIKGVKGELYPCKHDIFTQTYDSAPEQEIEVTGVAF